MDIELAVFLYFGATGGSPERVGRIPYKHNSLPKLREELLETLFIAGKGNRLV
jgi:hypothetical protein